MKAKIVLTVVILAMVVICHKARAASLDFYPGDSIEQTDVDLYRMCWAGADSAQGYNVYQNDMYIATITEPCFEVFYPPYNAKYYLIAYNGAMMGTADQRSRSVCPNCDYGPVVPPTRVPQTSRRVCIRTEVSIDGIPVDITEECY